MKTTTEYEPSDIDMKDELNGLLFAGMLIVSLTLPEYIKKDKEDGDTKFDTAATKTVSLFLNFLAKSGYTITKQESVPQVFRS